MEEPDMRAEMKTFWETQSQKSSADIFPSELTDEEVPEVISLLPDLQGKDVLELGAGPGRFTGKLCYQGATVTAVDFVERFIDKNRTETGQFDDVTYHCSDITILDLPANSYDVIFSNWLLMYLSDDECRELLIKALSWLREGGMFFFRESCFHKSEKQKVHEANPTIYRVPADYMSIIESVTSDGENGSHFGFELVLSRSIQTYAKRVKNNNQICWLLTKVQLADGSNQGFKTFQQFLDAKQYSRNGILRYENIFGHNYVSTGGEDTTKEFVDLLSLKPGQAVLDVGAGIGGGAFYMAQKYDVTVLAIDLSSNMVNIGLERANEIGDNRVQFEIADATKRQFPPGSFDVVYSRDTILHIQDKKALFASFFDWLKPGGKVLISDYCCGEGQLNEDYLTYVKSRGYYVLTVKDYGKILESVGFVNVRAEDKTEMFSSVLQTELARTKSIQTEFIEEFSQKDYDDIVNGWTDKLHRVGRGDQAWGLFYAEKPHAH